MKYIIDNKLFDSDKADLFFEAHAEMTIYKTKSGLFVQVFHNGRRAYSASENDVKRIVLKHGAEAYIKVFGPLEEY